MEAITKRKQLLIWLSQRLMEREPKFVMNEGLISTYELLIVELIEKGRFAVDPEDWGEWLDCRLASIMTGKAVRLYPGAIVGFTSTVYGGAIEHDEVTIDEAIWVLIEMLELREANILQERSVKKHIYVETTPEAARKYQINIGVKLKHRVMD
jgi:hypothetical protein